jgi:general secretion pathway protein E
VFTTVHANSVYDVLGRFLHMNVDPYSFSAALNGIVAQRLLRMNCEHCAVSVPPDAAALAESDIDPVRAWEWKFRAGKGCGQCRGTGYKGRRAVAEAMILNDELRELIAAKAPLSTLKIAAARAGVVPMREAALLLVERGETTLEEVNRVTF